VSKNRSLTKRDSQGKSKVNAKLNSPQNVSTKYQISAKTTNMCNNNNNNDRLTAFDPGQPG